MTCIWPTCKEPEHKQGYCYSHYRVYGTKEEKKQVKKIANLSPKRKELQKEYVKLVKKMLSENDRCEVKSPVCTGKAEGLNHKQKRTEKNLLDPANVERACNKCNLYIETHPDWAAENGHWISKHQIITTQ